MKINLIAIGKRMPAWVESGFNEYAKRLPNHLSLNLIEIVAGKRTKGANIEQLIQREGEQMLAAIPANNEVIALEVLGQKWDTPMLVEKLQVWQASGCDVTLLIGGPEGLAKICVARAGTKWSLSPLTLPHPLVRIVVAEQLYRAWSLSVGHPYSK